MSAARGLVLAVLVSLAVVLQTSVLPAFSWRGVVPDLTLLVVVATALVSGGRTALPLAFVAGLVLDLVPPADHVAGRWTLALLVAAYVASRFRDSQAGQQTATATMATVLACSVVAGSVFGLTGLLLRDPAVPVGEMLAVIGAGTVLDLVAAPLVMPAVMALLRRMQPDRLPSVVGPLAPRRPQGVGQEQAL